MRPTSLSPPTSRRTRWRHLTYRRFRGQWRFVSLSVRVSRGHPRLLEGLLTEVVLLNCHEGPLVRVNQTIFSTGVPPGKVSGKTMSHMTHRSISLLRCPSRASSVGRRTGDKGPVGIPRRGPGHRKVTTRSTSFNDDG